MGEILAPSLHLFDGWAEAVMSVVAGVFVDPREMSFKPR
jgi:hypothetical protein